MSLKRRRARASASASASGFMRAHSRGRSVRVLVRASYASGASLRASLCASLLAINIPARRPRKIVAGCDGIYFAIRIRHSPRAGAIIPSAIFLNCRCVVYEYAKPYERREFRVSLSLSLSLSAFLSFSLPLFLV